MSEEGDDGELHLLGQIDPKRIEQLKLRFDIDPDPGKDQLDVQNP